MDINEIVENALLRLEKEGINDTNKYGDKIKKVRLCSVFELLPSCNTSEVISYTTSEELTEKIVKELEFLDLLIDAFALKGVSVESGKGYSTDIFIYKRED